MPDRRWDREVGCGARRRDRRHKWKQVSPLSVPTTVPRLRFSSEPGGELGACMEFLTCQEGRQSSSRDGRGDGSYVEGTVRNTLWVKGHVTEKREARTVRLRGRTQRLPGQQKSTWSWRNQKGSRAAAGGWGQRAQGPLKEADRG